MVPDRVSERLELGSRGLPRHSDRIAEIAQRFRCDAASPHSGNRRHARIIPTGNVIFVDEPQKLSLAQHRVVELEPSELRLFRRPPQPPLRAEPSSLSPGGLSTPHWCTSQR